MTKETLKQMLNDIDMGLKNALIRINELVAENKALKEALAQSSYRAVKTYHEGKPMYVASRPRTFDDYGNKIV